MKNDKKKDDEKINFIFEKILEKLQPPGKYKYEISQIKKFNKNLF